MVLGNLVVLVVLGNLVVLVVLGIQPVQLIPVLLERPEHLVVLGNLVVL